MSNYYKSDCCGEPLTPLFLENGGTCADCPKCKRACVAVAVIDSPGGVPEDVKQYQEDIKAGVDVGTEQIRESELQDEFMAFWDEYKDKVGLGNYSDEITRFWFKKLSEQRQSILEEVEGLKHNDNWFDMGKPGEKEWEKHIKIIDTVLSIIKSK